VLSTARNRGSYSTDRSSNRGIIRIAAVVGGLLLSLASAGCADNAGDAGGTLQVSGSSTVNPVAADAAGVLRGQGMKITVDTQGGSAGGIAQLGNGQIDVAMSSKPLGDDDRKRFPDANFVATEIGRDAIGIVIRREVYDAGVTSLSRRQLQLLFEGKVANWRELGGPDVPVYVYDKEPGRGTREVLDKFLYGDSGSAPPAPTSGRYSIVGGNEETRTKLATTPGSVAPLSVSFAAGHAKLAAISVDDVEPTPANIRSGKYALARPLFLITQGAPQGDARRFIDYILSKPGQQLVTKHGFLNLSQLGLQ
jgi:phosphate transport system substrate-binding protein